MPVGTGLYSPETMLFIGPIQSLLPQINREPIKVDNDDTHCDPLEAHQKKI